MASTMTEVLVDVRYMPLEVQQIAYDKGLIQYIPGVGLSAILAPTPYSRWRGGVGLSASTIPSQFGVIVDVTKVVLL